MKLVIVDREGVLNRTVEGYVLAPEQWEPLPGSLEAVAALNHGGFRVAVATNQAPVSRGLLDMATLNAIHQRMSRLAEAVGGRIDAIAPPHQPAVLETTLQPRSGVTPYVRHGDAIPLALATFASVASLSALARGRHERSDQARSPA